MAGGVGVRFWPISNTQKPKQFLDMLGVGSSLLQLTYQRMLQLLPQERIIVVANERHKQLVKEQLPQLGDSQLLLEPIPRNTAPSVAYATCKIKAINKDAVMVIMPADQLILQENEFFNQLRTSVEHARECDKLFTIGVKPTRAETTFGYIQINTNKKDNEVTNLYKMKAFTEKPNEEMAELLYETGEFYWNSGMFIWSAASIERCFEKHHPDLHSQFFIQGEKLYGTSDEKNFIKKVFSESPFLSVDYAILEKADNIWVLCANFGWSDIGTWSNIYYERAKDDSENVVSGSNVFCYDTKRNLIHSETDRLVILNGVKDYVIIDSEQALLVCKRSNEEYIRQFLNDIRIKVNDKYIP